MSILTDSNLGDQVTQTIRQLIQDSPFGGLSSNEVFFSFSWPSQVLQDSIYQNPWTPSNPMGSMLATEYSATLADAVPLLNTYYAPSGDTVPDVYELVLNGFTLPGTQPGSPQLRGSNAAPLSLASLLLHDSWLQVLPKLAIPGQPNRQALTAPTPAYVQQLAAERQAANEHARQNAQRLQQGQPPQPQVVAAPATGNLLKFRAPLPADVAGPASPARVMISSTASSLDTIFNKAKAVYLGTQLASLQNPQLTFHATDIYPANFADPEAAVSWPSITLSYPLSQPQPYTVAVSFQFCRVDIVRAWMLPYLFSLQGWGVQGLARGGLSSGSPLVNTGVLPLLPVSLIMGRNLTVTSDSGQVLYSASGLQVLARVSKVQPLTPPQ